VCQLFAGVSYSAREIAKRVPSNCSSNFKARSSSAAAAGHEEPMPPQNGENGKRGREPLDWRLKARKNEVARRKRRADRAGKREREREKEH